MVRLSSLLSNRSRMYSMSVLLPLGLALLLGLSYLSVIFIIFIFYQDGDKGSPWRGGASGR